MKFDLQNRHLEAKNTYKIALAGNPNSGKTSLFNALTGARQHVGNYPGVTVEKRTGFCISNQLRFEIIDLPGTYSLTSYSPEERIAQDEILSGRYDVVMVVVDSTTLHRSLVLMAQIMLTGAKLVVCLNMSDEARRAGQRIDLDQMQTLLGFPVIETIGHRGVGVQPLLDAIQAALISGTEKPRLVLGEQLDGALAAIQSKLDLGGFHPKTLGWICSRLLVKDKIYEDKIQREAGNAMAVDEARRQRQIIESQTGVDISLFVTERFFGFVDGLLKEVVRQPSRLDARALSDHIDKVLVHRFFGLPIFAGVMLVIFWLTFTLGETPMDWIETGFGHLGDWLSGFWEEGSDSPLRSLLVEGIIAGVGGVLVFLPNIVLLFFGLALLENTGYMARAAFLMDRIMHRFGLHGKSFLPMLTGFGCSIPGIMATRILENERDRLTTMLVLPLMSCGARLPIWMLLIPAFFPPNFHAVMLWLIYAVGIILAFILALLLRRSIFKGEDAPFVMELPPYRLPTTKALVQKMLERSWLYLRKAGTVILGISILMWLITAYPKPDKYQIDADTASGKSIEPTSQDIESQRAFENLRHSIAGRLGRLIEPIVQPLGFDWKVATGMIGAFAAKEVFVAQMGIVYSMGEVDEGSESLRDALRRDYPPLVGLSLMLFLLIGTPCMATFAIVRRESGKLKWALLQFGGLTLIGYLVSLVVYQIGRWLV